MIIAAFEGALAELKLQNRDDPLVDMVAKRIVIFAQHGERDPAKLRELALQSLR